MKGNIDDVGYMMEEIVSRLKAFMENEARSCSMDFRCVTPEYVYRMWGGEVSFEEISNALRICCEERYECER